MYPKSHEGNTDNCGQREYKKNGEAVRFFKFSEESDHGPKFYNVHVKRKYQVFRRDYL